jgi:hypothetical protein
MLILLHRGKVSWRQNLWAYSIGTIPLKKKAEKHGGVGFKEKVLILLEQKNALV